MINKICNVKNSLNDGNTPCSRRDMTELMNINDFCFNATSNTAMSALQEFDFRGVHKAGYTGNAENASEIMTAFVNALYASLAEKNL